MTFYVKFLDNCYEKIRKSKVPKMIIFGENQNLLRIFISQPISNISTDLRPMRHAWPLITTIEKLSKFDSPYLWMHLKSYIIKMHYKVWFCYCERSFSVAFFCVLHLWHLRHFAALCAMNDIYLVCRIQKPCHAMLCPKTNLLVVHKNFNLDTTTEKHLNITFMAE